MKRVTAKAKKRSGSGSYAWVQRLVGLLMVASMAGALLFVYLSNRVPEKTVSAGIPSAEPDQAPGLPSPVPEKTPSITSSPSPQSPLPTAQFVPRHPVLYIVIDDCGYNLEALKAFFRFKGRLTFAVLPGLPHTTASARLVTEHGQGLILHQPMEAIDGQNPGPGLISSNQASEEIKLTLKRNLDELPGVQGINNHMGSRGTQDTRLLDTMMQVLLDRHLFFLDSRTSAKTQGFAVARNKGVPAMERDIFLDNEPDRESILQAINEGVRQAEKRGYAVMIGHAWSAELAQVLIDAYPHLVEQGYDFDSLINYFMGGQGFVESHASPAKAMDKPQ